MSRQKQLLLLLAIAAVGITCGDSVVTGPSLNVGPPAALHIISGDLQADTVGKELPEALVVRIVDSAGTPVPLQVINFRVVTGGGSVFAGVGLTDTLGQARERWTLGTVAGDTQTVEARAVDSQTGQALVFGTFKAIGLADAPSTMTRYAGHFQSGSVGTTLTDSLAVKITDQYENGVPGQAVTWAVTSGGGSVLSSSTTNSGGVAKTAWTLGTRADVTHTVSAAAAGLDTVTFEADPLIPNTSTLAVHAGDGQTGAAGTELTDTLFVSLKLADGQPVVGATVTWTVLTGGGTVSLATGVTNADGHAATQWTLGSATGAQSVQAEVLGLTPVQFSVTSEAGPPATLERVSGNAQIGDLGASLEDSLAIRVVDAHSNPVEGVTVGWTAAFGSITATSTSNASGVAKAQWTLGARLDTLQWAMAEVDNVSPIGFNATGRLPTSAVIAKTAGDTQSDTVGQVIADSLVVTVQLADGTPVWGAEVSWAATSGRGGSLSPATVTTWENGQGAAAWVIDTLVGQSTATATVVGLTQSSLTFTATGVPDAAATVVISPATAADSALLIQPDTVLTGDSLALVATAYDRFGNPKTDAQATWSSTDSAVATISSTGLVQALAEGSIVFGATVDAAEGEIDIAVQLRLPTSLELLAGSGQSDTVDATLPNTVEVRALDRRATPFEGAEITFRGTNGAPTDTTAGCSCKVVTTDADGVASTQWVLGITAGEAVMNALGEPPGGGSVFDSLSISATVLPGDSSSIVRVSGGGTSTTLTVAVRDRHGNGVLGTVIVWEVSAGTGELSPTMSTSDSSGLTSTSVVSAATAITVQALAPGLAGSPVTFDVDAIVPTNYALEYDQSWVTVPDHDDLDLSTSWTLEAWIRPHDVTTGSFQHLISKWNGGGDASYTMTISTNGRLRSGVHNGTTNTILESTVLLTDDVWQHVVVTFDNGERRLYINGVLDTTQTGAVIPMNSTRPLSFGREGPSYGGWRYDGLMDDVRVWNVARSGNEIATNMNVRLVGNEAGLVGYWRFDEGSGDIAFDATGNGHDGRLGNAVGEDVNDPQWTSDVPPISY